MSFVRYFWMSVYLHYIPSSIHLVSVFRLSLEIQFNVNGMEIFILSSSSAFFKFEYYITFIQSLEFL